jgi:hypothetical protein
MLAAVLVLVTGTHDATGIAMIGNLITDFGVKELGYRGLWRQTFEDLLGFLAIKRDTAVC